MVKFLYYSSLLLLSLNFMSAKLSAQDITPPVFIDFEPEISIECSDLDMIYVTSTDDSGDPVNITYTESQFSGGCSPNIFRTYIAEDSSGNTSQIQQVIIVEDLTPPIFLGAGEDMVMSCEETLPEVPEVIAYDECMGEELSEVVFQSDVIEGICEQIITWTWSATDECGNYGEYTKTITIVDETAPVFTSFPENMYIGCEEEYPEIPELEYEDNCTEITLDFSEETIEGGVDNGGVSYCTAQDVPFWNDEFSLKLVDSPAQENYTTQDLVLIQNPDMGEGSTAVLSGNIYGFDNPNAGWYVYMEFENGMDWEQWSTQDFETSYRDDFDIAEETHLDWTYLILSSTNSTLTGLGEYAGSELQLHHIPTNYYYGFQIGMGASNFTTNYGMSGWFMGEGVFYDSQNPDYANGGEFSAAGDIYTDLVCCPVESLVRTWTITDECTNMSSIQQVITKIDLLAPVFTNVPDDAVIECTEDIPNSMAEATDNCGEVTVMFEDEIIETECPSEYSIYRTFTATDECGLTATVTQIITVVDNTPPVFTNTPDDMLIDCEAEVPAAPSLEAEDTCGDEVTIDFSEVIIGDETPEGAESYCNAINPINTEDGWSLILFDELLGDLLGETTEANFTQYPDQGDGAWCIIEANIQSMDNENAGWTLSVLLNQGMNWDDWSNQLFPTSYKDDLEVAEDYYEDWMYFILDNGTLTGWGDYEGSLIELSHAPDNYYYAFQLGERASNVNMAYGVGGWFMYSGTIIDAQANTTVLVDGAGDLALDLDCCPAYEVQRTWTAEDCAGNTSFHIQTITFGEVEPPAAIAVEEDFRLAGASLEDIFKLSVTPNPVKSEANIIIDSKVNAQGKVELYNTQGVLIRSIWGGSIEKEAELMLSFDKGDLSEGIYIVKLRTLSGEVATKLIIKE